MTVTSDMHFIPFTRFEAISIYRDCKDEGVRARIWKIFFNDMCPSCNQNINGGDPFCSKCGFNLSSYALKQGFEATKNTEHVV